MRTLGLSTVLFVTLVAAAARAVTIPTVPVGNPGNPGDPQPGSHGSVRALSCFRDSYLLDCESAKWRNRGCNSFRVVS